MTKPCFHCGQPSELRAENRWFDPRAVFDAWSSENQIICDYRSRFDCMRDALDWASLDESAEGAHAECALRQALLETGWSVRYAGIPAGLNDLRGLSKEEKEPPPPQREKLPPLEKGVSRLHCSSCYGKFVDLRLDDEAVGDKWNKFLSDHRNCIGIYTETHTKLPSDYFSRDK